MDRRNWFTTIVGLICSCFVKTQSEAESLGIVWNCQNETFTMRNCWYISGTLYRVGRDGTLYSMGDAWWCSADVAEKEGRNGPFTTAEKEALMKKYS